MTDAVEEIRKAMKKEKYLLLSTGHKVGDRYRLHEYTIDYDSFCELFKPIIGEDIVIASELLNRTVGDTVLNAEIADYAALNRHIISILQSKYDTSANKVKKAIKAFENFDNEHKEQESETAMLINTVDK